MRLARDFGTIRELYPPGVDDLRELPYIWFDAIRRALTFLGFDELEPDERPPKSIWLDDEALRLHFDQVKVMREEKWGSGEERIDDPVENPAAKDLLIGG